jgi:hypothetical protein
MNVQTLYYHFNANFATSMHSKLGTAQKKSKHYVFCNLHILFKKPSFLNKLAVSDNLVLKGIYSLQTTVPNQCCNFRVEVTVFVCNFTKITKKIQSHKHLHNGAAGITSHSKFFRTS